MKQSKQSNKKFKAQALNSKEKSALDILGLRPDLVYQTQESMPKGIATPEGVTTTFKITSKDALRDDNSSPGPCKNETSKALTKAERLAKATERQLTEAQRNLNIVEENIASKATVPSREIARKGIHTQGRVLVIGQDSNPCMPCNPARTRKLLKAGKAKIHLYFPFVIQLNYSPTGTQPVQLKGDPGTRTTGICLNILTQHGWRTVWAMHLVHHPDDIRNSLTKRRSQRNGRRSRNTRYRPPRWNNRKRAKGWLAPSLMTNVINLVTWVKRLKKHAPVTQITIEDVKFDTQLMQNPDISGLEYQYGTLHGTDIREHTFWKCNYTCSYCGKKNVPLTVDHIKSQSPRTPDRQAGTNTPSNLTAACKPCNQEKSNYSVEEFAIMRGVKSFPLLKINNEKNLKAVGISNSIRLRIIEETKNATGINPELGSGGRTKFNRENQKYPKTHFIDAACAGESGAKVSLNPNMQIYIVKACSRNARRMQQPDSFGFPKGKAKEFSCIHGVRTGDIGKAVVTKGKNKGTWIGRISIRSTGTFKVGNKDGVNYKKIKVIQRNNGYSYNFAYPPLFQNPKP